VKAGEGKRRVVIERVRPEVDCGRFPVKRAVGESVEIEADVFADGHDMLACVVQFRREGTTGWTEAPMEPLVDDAWRGEFPVSELGRYEYTITGWIDRFGTWRRPGQEGRGRPGRRRRDRGRRPAGGGRGEAGPRPARA